MAKGHISFGAGFLGPEMIATKPIGKIKYLDWEKAKQLIFENPTATITAGLQEDWDWTSDVIYKHGRLYAGSGIWGSSNWATPILDIDGKEVECWTYEETKEGSGTPDWLKRPHVIDYYEDEYELY